MLFFGSNQSTFNNNIGANLFTLTLAYMWQTLLTQIQESNIQSLSRAISLVENEVLGYEQLLKILPKSSSQVIGITGPPGAGKSTLTDALIEEWVNQGKKIGVICVDPSSPFNYGALLGDRIRMSNWYNHPNVFIRSLASRGSLGGLHPKILEILEVIKAANFDYILIETVGVGQTEIEVAGIADLTLVVLVPESGDHIQIMKAGLMEIAQLFVVNKADRNGADQMVKNLLDMLASEHKANTIEIPVLKTSASNKEGISILVEKIEFLLENRTKNKNLQHWHLAQKAYHIIQTEKMKVIDKKHLLEDISLAAEVEGFNLYQFVDQYFGNNSTI